VVVFRENMERNWREYWGNLGSEKKGKMREWKKGEKWRRWKRIEGKGSGKR
jgi:hypothetical protein